MIISENSFSTFVIALGILLILLISICIRNINGITDLEIKMYDELSILQTSITENTETITLVENTVDDQSIMYNPDEIDDVLKKNNILLKIDNVDIYYLAKNIYHEARCQPELGKIAVGLVVLNRVKDNRFPETIENVITQKKQFSWYPKYMGSTPKDKDAWEDCKIIAERLVNNDVKDFTEGSTHYHAARIRAWWSKDKRYTNTIRINDHIFYRWEKNKK